MVDSQSVPPRDGLDDLFGAGGFNWGVTPSTEGSTPTHSTPAGSGALPSRRELRNAPKGRKQASRTAAKNRGSSSAGRTAPAQQRSRAKAATRREKPPRFVSPVDSAYPAGRTLVVVRQPPTKKAAGRGRGFLTIVAVAGLFGAFALPAYAFVPPATTDTASVSTVASIGADEAALAVPKDAPVEATVRGQFGATTAGDLRAQRRTAALAANFAEYMASGAREQGDDYPWFSELSNNQGGGLSPLNYFYRECVDFVAWRLNRDAGSVRAPYLYVWSTLTPTGGNAYQWKYAWTKKGWPTSTTPIVGSVAWFAYNHVAYVKAVNGDGTVLIEEYNQAGTHRYDQRVINATDAQLYLYPPPR